LTELVDLVGILTVFNLLLPAFNLDPSVIFFILTLAIFAIAAILIIVFFLLLQETNLVS
jgi:hypothetical protein